jgi:hypothetical protein
MQIWLTGSAQYFTISKLNQSKRGWKGGFDEGAKAYFAQWIEILSGRILGFMR